MAHYATVHCPATQYGLIYYTSLYNAVNNIDGDLRNVFTRDNGWATGEWLYDDPSKTINSDAGWYNYAGTIREGYADFAWNGDDFVIVTMLGEIEA